MSSQVFVSFVVGWPETEIALQALLRLVLLLALVELIKADGERSGKGEVEAGRNSDGVLGR